MWQAADDAVRVVKRWNRGALEAMEPAPKRPRLGYEQCAFVFQNTTPQPDGTLWPPKLLRLIVTVTGDTNQVECDGSPPHGSWMQLPDVLTITFHHSGGTNVKTHVFKQIAGTEAWLQISCFAPWQGVLIPHNGGTMSPVITESDI